MNYEIEQLSSCRLRNCPTSIIVLGPRMEDIKEKRKIEETDPHPVGWTGSEKTEGLGSIHTPH